mmetsp:Transcript_2062/g.4690  ORF Transcript_2062/g.4690 Transcript_2062/m.4690 type:complete len:357 (-) Transcript_2062:366-1436(-)
MFAGQQQQQQRRSRDVLVRDLRLHDDPKHPRRQKALEELCALWRTENGHIPLVNVWGVDLTSSELEAVMDVLQEKGAVEVMISARLPIAVIPAILAKTMVSLTMELDTSDQAQLIAKWLREHPLGPLRKLILELSVVLPRDAEALFHAAETHSTLKEVSIPDSVMIGNYGAEAAGRLLARNSTIKRTRLEYLETACELQCVAAREYHREIALDTDCTQRVHRQALVFTSLGISIAMVSRLGVEDTIANQNHRFRVFAIALGETSGWAEADSHGEAYVRLPLDQVTQTVAKQMGSCNDIIDDYFDFVSDDFDVFGVDYDADILDDAGNNLHDQVHNTGASLSSSNHSPSSPAPPVRL